MTLILSVIIKIIKLINFRLVIHNIVHVIIYYKVYSEIMPFF